jgi:acyl-CoA synthetase (AMP-forming)/AMP-acid ligase II
VLQFSEQGPELVPTGCDGAAQAPGDIIMPTSGSTGQPKGVAYDLMQAAANASLAGIGLGIEPLEFWSTEGDLSTVSALAHVLMAWRSGKTLWHLKGMDYPRRELLFSAASGGYGGAPLQLRELSQRLSNSAPAVMVSSGDFLTPAMAEAILGRFPDIALHKMYGLTECAGRFCVLPHEQRQASPSAAGRPMPGFETRIVDPDENGAGEVAFASPMLFHGYWRRDSGFVRREPGYFRTGDHGTIDRKDERFLQGRWRESRSLEH